MFLFNLYYEGVSEPLAVSEAFNITGDSSSSTTTTTSSTTSSSTASDYGTAVSTTWIYSTATATAAVPTAASTTSSNSNSTVAVSAKSSAGLTTGTKAGIGVAVPVVALGALAAGCYYLFQRRRAKKQQGLIDPSVAAEQGSSPEEKEQKLPELMSGTAEEEPQIHELHGVSGTPSTLYELSGDVTRK